jgi:hypothetical protein
MLAMQNIVGLIEIDAQANSARASEDSGPLSMLLALAELLPENGCPAGLFLHPGSRLRVCNFSPPVVFARLDMLRSDLDDAFTDLRRELSGHSAAAA